MVIRPYGTDLCSSGRDASLWYGVIIQECARYIIKHIYKLYNKAPITEAGLSARVCITTWRPGLSLARNRYYLLPRGAEALVVFYPVRTWRGYAVVLDYSLIIHNNIHINQFGAHKYLVTRPQGGELCPVL